MAIKQQFFYPSSDDIHQINAIRWLPEQTPYKGIVQIVHGMVEFIDRYDEFARFLCDKGYIVVGEDHLGHGHSVNDESEWGYFGKSNGFNFIIKDLCQLHKMQTKEFGDIPYYMLGHSMGSFLARIYITKYGRHLTGAIIMGTGNQPPALAGAGLLLAYIISAFKGDTCRCPFINNMAFGAYNKKFEPARTNYDWLTKDEAIVDTYVKEPRCTFMFTLGAYKELFKGLLYVGNKKNIAKTPKELPILVISGAMDPVGDFGKGVQGVYEMFVAAGIDDAAIKLYDDGRHEILNETNRQEVYEDISVWLNAH